MKLIKGKVLGVADKGEGDKRWAIVAIEETSQDRDGFMVTETIKLSVFGDAIKNGVHNAYRNIVGQEVYVPFNVEGDQKYIGQVRYLLAGPPLKIADKAQA